jgi:phage baseplate assembly protein W
MSGRHLAFPFRIAADGRSATPADLESHVKMEVIQLLLTNAGERPMLPGFGGGLRRLVFERNDAVGAAIAKSTISGALQEWLGHRVEVLALEVENEDSTMRITLKYRIRETGEEMFLRFEHQG